VEVWSGLNLFKAGPIVLSFCEYDDELSCSIRTENFLIN
jgi:hypothetical protein